MIRTLKGFILTASVLVSIVFFGGTYLIISSIYDESVKESAIDASNTLAQVTFSSMFQIMSRGWERTQLEDFLAATKEAVAHTSTKIEIYRGGIVSERFGPIEQSTPDAAIEKTFRLAEPIKIVNGASLRYTFPLKAESKCLHCHVNAAPGDVLGVIDIDQDLHPFMEKARQQFIVSLTAIAPIPFIVAILVVVFVNKRIDRSIGLLGRKIDSINTVSDLTALELDSAQLGLEELDNIVAKVGELAGKLKTVAVDKKLLIFEISLLEKFVITSEVVKDWREYVGRLLVDINTVIDAYTLFSIFKVDDELFDLEIFWRSTPSERTRAMLEDAVRQKLKQHPHFTNIPTLSINHNVGNTSETLEELSEKDIQVQVKSLFVDVPKIGGIVGIGVQANSVKDETRLLVMESILSTLLNVVGSVKAIYKYTRDLEYYATRDPLTNLYNQRLFWELLDYEVGRAARHEYQFALLVIDLDNFKTINDSYGHAFGDKFLQEFALQLKQALRAEDILARYGGDEFVVIMPETDLEEAAALSERLLEITGAMAVTAPDGANVRGSVSIGISLYPEHATGKKDLFLFADNMMYKAKGEGKCRIGIPSDEDVVDVFRQIGEKSQIIFNAVEERRVIPFFQPILATDDNRIEAVEVLSRIQLEGDLVLGAHEFIELAERMRVIHKLDYIVMEKALTAVQEQGFEGLVFLNLSPRALVLKEFIHEVRRIVAESGISPGRIVFEITERDTVKNMAVMEQFVNELKLEGFRLAIDDFGSGFSSFHYIKRFPIDFIKIEGDFIANMVRDDKDLAFVRSIATLAQHLGIRTVAEYVEDEEVLEAVRATGIDLAQGYHTGVPREQLPLRSRPAGAEQWAR